MTTRTFDMVIDDDGQNHQILEANIGAISKKELSKMAMLNGVCKSVSDFEDSELGDQNHGLLESMIKWELRRRAYLEDDGKMQIDYTKSNEGWIATLFTLKGRALDLILWPWIILTLNATVWTLVAELYMGDYGEEIVTGKWDSFFSIVLNTSLAFLLVFRLNRAAERFWVARQSWGLIVGLSRNLVSGVLVHGQHNQKQQDEVIKWVAAFSIATMQFMRGYTRCPHAALIGILTKEESKELSMAAHAPLYAACHARTAIRELFRVTAETPPSIAYVFAQQLQLLETLLNSMMDNEGAMERIRSTPLPLVYVSHLRTFLLFFLATLPYIFHHAWGWFTIPIVTIISFALLGLEGASQEVECPFDHDRPNHLNMNAFCLQLLGNIQQMMQHASDLDRKKDFFDSASVLSSQNGEQD